MRNSTLHRLALLLPAAVCLILQGCVGYQLGSMLPADIRSVYIPTFANKTAEPLIEFDTTQAAIQAFQRDGSIEVSGGPETADAVLNVTILDYDLAPVGFDRERKTKTDEYRLTLTVSLNLVRQANQQIVVESPRVQGDYTFTVSGDLTSSKKSALPQAAQDLAHDIVETVVEAWQ
jgi:outer membrane lipopolysaccharide assembly protein LptE/RlpB